MKKRLRKKKYLKEYAEIGVKIVISLDNEDDHLWRFIEEVVENNNWFCTGGIATANGDVLDGAYDFLIYKEERYGKFNMEDVNKLESALDDFDPERRFEILGLCDLWHEDDFWLDSPSYINDLKEAYDKINSR